MTLFFDPFFCVIVRASNNFSHLAASFLVFDSLRKTIFHALVLSQMRTHQTLPQLPMVRHKEVKQLMDNDVIPQFLIKGEQFSIKV